MMKKKGEPSGRGQVAIENLVLYGAVLLMVVIGVLVVWQSGMLKPPVGKRGYVGFSQIVPRDWTISNSYDAHTKNVLISLKCEGDAPVILEALKTEVTVNRAICDPGPDSDVPLNPGDIFTLELKCPGVITEYEIGDEFVIDASINYTNKLSNRKHTSVGKIYGFVEFVPPDYVPPVITTPTIPSTVPPQCMGSVCTMIGTTDEANCGNITWDHSTRTCMYCPLKFVDFDGKSICWPNGNCGDECNVDRDCIIPPTPNNLCKTCDNGVCTETPNTPVCGACPPEVAGTINDTYCPSENCTYCLNNFEVIGNQCTEKKDCGDACTNFRYDDYAECKRLCTHCKEDPKNPGIGKCEQGDCGMPCSSTDDPTCDEGCRWCNMTSRRCEMGDCGKSCDETSDCLQGCTVCQGGVCNGNSIGVTILATNGTRGPPPGKNVAPNQQIFLDVRGTTVSGSIGQLLVSQSVKLPSGGYDNCYVMAAARNDAGDMSDPGVGATTDPWFVSRGIPLVWRADRFVGCPVSTTCANTWLTSEALTGRYCYFALAQRAGGAGGEWSALAADYIDVGNIKVQLIYPLDKSKVG
jgi:hypothetical protein